MTSVSHQNRSYTHQPSWQSPLKSKRLPGKLQAPLPNKPPNPVHKKNKKNKKQKKIKKKKFIIKYTDHFNTINIKNLIRNCTIGLNWQISKPNNNGPIFVLIFDNNKKELCNEECSWAYIDPNTNFIYIGNNEHSWKLGWSNQYFINYCHSTVKNTIKLINELNNPLDI